MPMSVTLTYDCYPDPDLEVDLLKCQRKTVLEYPMGKSISNVTNSSDYAL